MPKKEQNGQGLSRQLQTFEKAAKVCGVSD